MTTENGQLTSEVLGRNAVLAALLCAVTTLVGSLTFQVVGARYPAHEGVARRFRRWAGARLLQPVSGGAAQTVISSGLYDAVEKIRALGFADVRAAQVRFLTARHR